MLKNLFIVVCLLVCAAVRADKRDDKQDEEDVQFAPPPIKGTPDELAGARAIKEGKWIRARELGEKITKEHPQSYAGHFILGFAFHYAEGDLARSEYQLELAMSVLESRVGKNSDAAVRARLVEGRPLHREITAAWQARGT